MRTTRWGIVGPGSIANNFADGLAGTEAGRLLAIASRNANRRTAFGDKYGIAHNLRFDSYENLVHSPEIDAVYVATPHPWHAEHAILALRAGKPVLLEKPAGLNESEVIALTDVARQQNVFFMEAFMYLCHPQIRRMLDIIASGEIGNVTHIRATFGFNAAFDAQSRLYDKALGGGGILDVGCYPVSFSRLVAGAAIGKPFDEPLVIRGTGRIGKSGVDEEAYGLLGFRDGLAAEIACAVSRTMENRALVAGTNGSIELLDPWIPGQKAAPADAMMHVTVDGKKRIEEIKAPQHLYTFEAEAASQAIAKGLRQIPAPAMTPEGSIGNARVLDRWLAEVGYEPLAQSASVLRHLLRTIPSASQPIPKARLEGVPQQVSKLVLGCDNRDDLASGAIMWDAWIEAGGNAFDTGFVYGGGLHEKVLGQWIARRRVEKEIIVIAKGAHTPYCTPRAIAAQLDISLERLQINHAPIYIMHRDNPDVPVGEFVDALNRLVNAGRIGIYGGSNWSVARFEEARAYAKANGLQPPVILNNNLSLAVMEKPVWAGCITSNMPETLDYLRSNNITHLSWSSQARGYFLPADLRNRLSPDTSPETCFGSPANAERRKRAEDLAAKYKVSAHNIATAWVLAQGFPSFALVGPRSPGEIVSTLPGLSVKLSAEEAAWLNLET